MFFAAMVTAFMSCEDEVTDLPSPAITDPAAATLEVGSEVTIDFVFVAEAGFKSSAVTATGGTAVVSTDGTAGATSGTITVTFTAGATAGAGSVSLVVTDNESDSDESTVVITIAEEVKTITLTSNISTNTTWETGKTYILGGRIAVVNGVTLTIQPGVVVKGQAGTGSNATALLIARGGKLMAEGTAALPIIFTSVADELTPEDVAAGNFASPNLEPTITGLWGGLLVLGKANISASNSSGQLSEVQIEGIPTSDSNGLYGGTDDADNSGVIKYISIRHGGSLIGAGNEINGLTLGGVGSGTVIENVEVVGNQDDGIEWFGGTVNVKNVVVWNAGDDGLDTDQAYAGTVDNFVIVTAAGHSFELDGPEGTYGTTGSPAVTSAFHTFKNGTVVATSASIPSENLINTDANSGVKFDGLFVTGLANSSANTIINRVSTSSGVLTFTDVVLNVPAGKALADFFPAGTTIPAGITANATAAKKADVTVLAWTWTGKTGALAGL